jgi:1-acyl-sn-glycerol-3-phosphate acyltransferase
LLYPFFRYNLRKGRFSRVYRLKQVWGKFIAYGPFLFPSIHYKSAHYKFPQPCVVVSNHTSYLDIVFTTFYIGHTAVYMGKHELLKLPLFGDFFRYLDIPVNRRSLTDSHRAFTEAGRKLDKGFSVVIYPEGTISSSGKLKPFKNGAFRLAISRQVPVVPVVNLNNWQYLQNGGFFKSNGRPGIPRILVGDPIDTRGMDEKNVGELRDKVFTFIRQELEKHYGKHD